MTIDTLLSAQVVLASGEIVLANEKENQDLFWAIRGSLLFRTIPDGVFQEEEVILALSRNSRSNYSNIQPPSGKGCSSSCRSN